MRRKWRDVEDKLNKFFRGDLFDQAPEGSTYCVHRCRGQWSNLGGLLCKIIKKAGIEPWPKLMQNLRSTRETELFKETNGNIKAVCSWLGNSPAIALQHYAQTTEADFKEAAKNKILNQAEDALQKALQTGAESCRTEPRTCCTDIDVTLCEFDTKPQDATACNDMQKDGNWALLDLNQ